MRKNNKPVVKTQTCNLKHFFKYLILNTLYFILCFVSGFMLQVSGAQAVSMDSSRFRIQNSTIHIDTNDLSSSNFALSTTLGQTGAHEFNANGYIVRANPTTPITISLSKSSAEFGSITPHTSKTAQATISISYSGLHGYQLAAQVEGPLRTFDGSKNIPHTVCNGGKETCTYVKAAPWTEHNRYGFGYTAKGTSAPPDFINSNYFRPFADESLGQHASIFMQSQTSAKKNDATITFKINTGTQQQSGTYTTNINFIATPGF